MKLGTELVVINSNDAAPEIGLSRKNLSRFEERLPGLPIIAFDVNFNRVTTKECALYFFDADSLIAHLSSQDESHLKKSVTN